MNNFNQQTPIENQTNCILINLLLQYGYIIEIEKPNLFINQNPFYSIKRILFDSTIVFEFNQTNYFNDFNQSNQMKQNQINVLLKILSYCSTNISIGQSMEIVRVNRNGMEIIIGEYYEKYLKFDLINKEIQKCNSEKDNFVLLKLQPVNQTMSVIETNQYIQNNLNGFNSFLYQNNNNINTFNNYDQMNNNYNTFNNSNNFTNQRLYPSHGMQINSNLLTMSVPNQFNNNNIYDQYNQINNDTNYTSNYNNYNKNNQNKPYEDETMTTVFEYPPQAHHIGNRNTNNFQSNQLIQRKQPVKRFSSYEHMIFLNNTLISLIRKLDYTITIVPQKKMKEMQFYYVSTIRHIHRMHNEYDFAVEWSHFIREDSINGVLLDDFHYLCDLERLDELNNLNNFNNLNPWKLLNKQQMTSEDKIFLRNRIVKFIQHIQINSMIEIIEKETKYIFNYKTKDEKFVKKADRVFPISISRENERKILTMEQFIQQENDGDLINEFSKDIKRKIMNQKTQQIDQNSAKENSHFVFVPNPLKTIPHSLRRDRDQNEEKQFINQWNICCISILLTLNYSIEFKNMSEIETTFVYIDSLLKYNQINQHQEIQQIEIFNDELFQDNEETMKRNQLMKMIEIINNESQFIITYFSNDEIFIPRYIQRKENLLNNSNTSNCSNVSFIYTPETFGKEFHCKEIINNIIEERKQNETILSEINKALINYLQSKDYSFELLVYRLSKTNQRQNEFDMINNEENLYFLTPEIKRNEQQNHFLFINKIFGKNREILFDLNSSNNFNNNNLKYNQWIFRDERYQHRKTIQLYEMKRIIEQENGMKFIFEGIKQSMKFIQIINKNNHIIQISKFLEKFTIFDQMKNGNVTILYDDDFYEKNEALRRMKFDLDEFNNLSQFENDSNWIELNQLDDNIEDINDLNQINDDDLNNLNEINDDDELMEIFELENYLDSNDNDDFNELIDESIDINNIIEFDEKEENQINEIKMEEEQEEESTKTLFDIISNDISVSLKQYNQQLLNNLTPFKNNPNELLLCELNNTLINVLESFNYIIEITQPSSFVQPIFWEIKTLKKPNEYSFLFDRDYHIQKTLFALNQIPFKEKEIIVEFEMIKRQILTMMEILRKQHKLIFFFPNDLIIDYQSLLPKQFMDMSQTNEKKTKQNIEIFIEKNINKQRFETLQYVFESNINSNEIILPSTPINIIDVNLLNINCHHYNEWNSILITILKEYGYLIEEKEAIHPVDKFKFIASIRKENKYEIILTTTQINECGHVDFQQRNELKMKQMEKLINVINKQHSKYQIIYRDSFSSRETKFRIPQYIRISDKCVQIDEVTNKYIQHQLQNEKLNQMIYSPFTSNEFLIGSKVNFDEEKITNEQRQKMKNDSSKNNQNNMSNGFSKPFVKEKQKQINENNSDTSFSSSYSILKRNMMKNKSFSNLSKQNSMNYLQYLHNLNYSNNFNSNEIQDFHVMKTTVFNEKIDDMKTLEMKIQQCHNQFYEQILNPAINRITRIKVEQLFNEKGEKETKKQIRKDITEICSKQSLVVIKRKNKEYCVDIETRELKKRFVISIVYILLTRFDCIVEVTGNPFSPNLQNLYITSIYNSQNQCIYRLNEIGNITTMENDKIIERIEKYEFDQLVKIFEDLTSIEISITSNKKKPTNIKMIQTKENMMLNVETFFKEYCIFNDISTIVNETRKYLVKEFIQQRSGIFDMFGKEKIQSKIVNENGQQNIVFDYNTIYSMLIPNDLPILSRYADYVIYQYQHQELNRSSIDFNHTFEKNFNQNFTMSFVSKDQHRNGKKQKQQFTIPLEIDEHHKIIQRKRNEDLEFDQIESMKMIECFDQITISEDNDNLFDSSDESDDEYEDVVVSISEDNEKQKRINEFLQSINE